jgi:hypothetical protein
MQQEIKVELTNSEYNTISYHFSEISKHTKSIREQKSGTIMYFSLFYFIFSYRSRVDVNAIEYKKFCDEIESIFTTNFLEKNPLVESEQYVAIKDATNNQLDPEKEDRVKNLMNKMAQRVSLLCIFLFIYKTLIFI